MNSERGGSCCQAKTALLHCWAQNGRPFSDPGVVPPIFITDVKEKAHDSSGPTQITAQASLPLAPQVTLEMTHLRLLRINSREPCAGAHSVTMVVADLTCVSELWCPRPCSIEKNSGNSWAITPGPGAQYFFFFLRPVSIIYLWLACHYVDQAGLKLKEILLPLLPEYCD